MKISNLANTCITYGVIRIIDYLDPPDVGKDMLIFGVFLIGIGCIIHLWVRD